MMKKILVTGCNGQLGRAIRQEYKGEDVSFINTDVAEGEGIVALDITDVNAVLALVRAERPDVIINCAAHTNVDACPKNDLRANSSGMPHTGSMRSDREI